MEDEAQKTSRAEVPRVEDGPRNLAEAIHARFAALGGVDLPEILREPMRSPPDFK